MIERKMLSKEGHKYYVLTAKTDGRDTGQRTAEVWEILT